MTIPDSQVSPTLDVDFEVTPRRVASWTAVCIAALTAAYLTTGFLRKYGWLPVKPPIHLIFHVDEEGSIPTWFSVVLMLLCSAQAAILAAGARMRGDRWTRWWAGLAGILLLMSIDEIAQFHERVGIDVAKEYLLKGTAGANVSFLFFPWIIFGALVALFVGLVYIRFVWSLPPRTRNLIIGAAALFLGGALGVESLNGHLASLNDGMTQGIAYAVGTGLEEAMEMSGLAMLLYALVDYRPIRVRLSAAAPAVAERPVAVPE